MHEWCDIVIITHYSSIEWLAAGIRDVPALHRASNQLTAHCGSWNAAPLSFCLYLPDPLFDWFMLEPSAVYCMSDSSSLCFSVSFLCSRRIKTNISRSRPRAAFWENSLVVKYPDLSFSNLVEYILSYYLKLILFDFYLIWSDFIILLY